MSGSLNTGTKPRVAIVGQLNTLGGVQSCIFTLIRGLNHYGVIPDIVWGSAPNWRLLDQERAQAGFRKIPFRVSTRWLDRAPDTLAYTLRIANTVRGNHLEAEYDFFYLFFNGFLLSAGTPHVRYLSGPPLLPQLVNISPGVRGLPFRFTRRLYRSFLRKALPAYEFHKNDRYVVNSQYIAELFEEAHGVRLPVVYPPINFAGRSFTADDLSRRDTITFFSRVADSKRPEMVIDLAARFPHLRCVIMGSVPPHREPYFARLKEYAKAAGRPDIVFIATPSNERVREELARTRFYIFTAVKEHFGMTTPEAIASGAIPYVHDSGGQREIVPDPRLRFTDDVFFSRFTDLERLPEPELNTIRSRLNAHIRQYSEEVFNDRMIGFLRMPPQPGAELLKTGAAQVAGEQVQ